MIEKYDKKVLGRHPPLSSRKSQNIVTENAKRIYSAPGGFKYATAWITYVLLGSWLFLVLEKTTADITIPHEKWTRFKDLYISGEGAEELKKLKLHLSKLCPHELFNASFENHVAASVPIAVITPPSGDEGFSETNFQFPGMHGTFEEVERNCQDTLLTLEQITTSPEWTMIDAIYYTMTLVTTIGFGHISPTTDKGKIFCIFYALVGVPLTCILMARSSNWLSTKMVGLYQSAKKRLQVNQKTLLWIVTWMFISVGFIVFMFIPSVAFVYIEQWTFVDSIYFTFITLTTIGFGDFIAGYNRSTTFASLYKLFIVVWIMFALGYWVMCLSFLQKAIKQNAKNIRKTFRRKTIAKHAEVIKQMMSKLKSEPEETPEVTAQRAHMMAILVESVMKRNPLGHNQSYSCLGNTSDGLPRNASVIKKPTDTEDIGNAEIEQTRVVSSGSSIDIPFSLDDLLNSTVVLQKDHLPGIESMVGRISNDFPQQTYQHSIMSPNSAVNNNEDTLRTTVTVRELMSVAFLLSSMTNGSESMDTDSRSEGSDTLMEVTVHPREKIPLLRNILQSEMAPNEIILSNVNPKPNEPSFLNSHSSFSDANEKSSYRQCEVATG